MERYTDAEYDMAKMKTRAEVIVRLADEAYHNHMGGDWFMMRGVDTELAAWMLGEDHDTFYDEVVAEAEAILAHEQAKYAAAEGNK